MMFNKQRDISIIIYPDEDTPGLFLGTFNFAQNPDSLKQYSIGAILTIGNFTPHISQHIEYKQIVIEDKPTENILAHFDQTGKWIDKLRERKINVLVHCLVGKSRSPTIVAAYLMMKKGIGTKDALRILENKRRININEGFLKQLRDYEGKLQKKEDL